MAVVVVRDGGALIKSETFAQPLASRAANIYVSSIVAFVRTLVILIKRSARSSLLAV